MSLTSPHFKENHTYHVICGCLINNNLLFFFFQCNAYSLLCHSLYVWRYLDRTCRRARRPRARRRGAPGGAAAAAGRAPPCRRDRAARPRPRPTTTRRRTPSGTGSAAPPGGTPLAWCSCSPSLWSSYEVMTVPPNSECYCLIFITTSMFPINMVSKAKYFFQSIITWLKYSK